MVSQEQLHQLEQHENDMEERVDAVAGEPASAEGQVPPTLDKETKTSITGDNAKISAGEENASSPVPKRKRKRKVQSEDIEAISPKPSVWPLALSFSIAVLLLGVVTNLVVLGVGVVLIVVSVVGWLRERR